MKRITQDIILNIILVSFSFFLVSFLSSANYILTGYPDWVVHAFRIQSIQNHGLVSWSHRWANGIDLWQSYQFVPQVITAFFATLFHVTAGRMMIILTIFIFVFVRIEIYWIIRLLKYSPVTAFVAAFLSLTIGQFWAGVNEFSMIFSFATFPIIVYLCILYRLNKIRYIFPYIIGLCFYIHPILAIYSLFLWFFENLISNKHLIGKKFFIELGIFIASSSLFWLPLFVKDSANISNPYLSSLDFIYIQLRVFQYYGLSIYLFIALFITVIFSLVNKRSDNWNKFLILYALVSLFIVIASSHGMVPSFINQAQFVRGVSFIGIAIVISSSSIIEFLKNLKIQNKEWFFVIVLILIAVEAMWQSNFYSAIPIKNYQEPVSSYEKINKINLSDGRIWTPQIDFSSYLTSDDHRYVSSYMSHLESNIVTSRLSYLMQYQQPTSYLSNASVLRLADYFKLTGVKYIVLEENSPISKTIDENFPNDFNKMGSISLVNYGFTFYRVAWQERNAVLMDYQIQNSLSYFKNNLELGSFDKSILDDQISTFTKEIYDPRKIILPVSYPTEEEIDIKIPNRNQNYVFLNESYSPNWKITFNNEKVSYQPIGPSYLLITLPHNSSSGMLILKHTRSSAYYIALCLMLLSLLGIILNSVYRKRKLLKL